MRAHIADFWAYNDLLDKATVPDPNRHFNYRWDDEKQDVLKLPDPPRHFDYDTLITIAPDEYHTLKDSIGNHVLGLLRQKSSKQ